MIKTSLDELSGNLIGVLILQANALRSLRGNPYIRDDHNNSRVRRQQKRTDNTDFSGWRCWAKAAAR
jgi:hypothetical protein